MAILDEQDRQRLLGFLLQSLDEDNARDLETFARNFLHNGKIWDMIADAFPQASASAVKAVMMEAFESWQQARATTH